MIRKQSRLFTARPGCWLAAADVRWSDVVSQLREMSSTSSAPPPSSLLASARSLIPSIRLDDFLDPSQEEEEDGCGGDDVEQSNSQTAERRVWTTSRTRTGLRAVAIDRSGNIVDDLVVRKGAGATHVLSVPSQGATMALTIADDIVRIAKEKKWEEVTSKNSSSSVPDGCTGGEEECGDGRW